jgi:decaprenylphospho-beta-D-erythro-pentofuranosid-2-ulose 2-reductase
MAAMRTVDEAGESRSPQHVTLILGATSGIGKALARRLAGRGHALVLAGRDAEELELLADDLRIRYQVKAAWVQYEATDFNKHPRLFADCNSVIGSELDGVVFCHGTMLDQPESERDFTQVRNLIDVNFTTAVSLLNLAAKHLATRRAGFICALSSVAGDRGRQSNFIYGSTKAALTTYLQGLRNRLSSSGVAVITIKPGFVDTAMTWGLLNPRSPLVANPDQVAAAIDRAILRRRNVVYVPWFWWIIMAIIKAIPEPLFKRMKL